MINPMLPLPGLSPVAGKNRRQIRRRLAVIRWRRSGFTRGRATSSRRRTHGRLHRRSARAGLDHAHARRHHSLSPVDDRGGLRGRHPRHHYDEYGFQPIVVFDGAGRFITAVLRPAKRPGGKEIRAFLRRLLRAIRANWPKTEILLRGDSHYCCPEVLDWCRANGIDYILGVAPTPTLRSHILGLEARVKARFEAAPKQGKARGFREFYDGAASWSRVERVIARIEAGLDGPDTRFVVTSLKKRNARGSTRMFIAVAAKPRTTSNPGRRIWPPTARHA